jgi:hypothetical protein
MIRGAAAEIAVLLVYGMRYCILPERIEVIYAFKIWVWNVYVTTPATELYIVIMTSSSVYCET